MRWTWRERDFAPFLIFLLERDNTRTKRVAEQV
jgi:hypothetical protein